MVFLDVIRNSDLFDGLDETILGQVASLGREEEYRGGETVYAEETPATRLYLLERGSVVLFISAGLERSIEIGTITSEGEAFGCSSLVEPGRYMNTATCIHKTRLIAIDAYGLRVVLDHNHPAGYVVFQNLANVLQRRRIEAEVQIRNVLSPSRPGTGQPPV